MKRLFHFFIDGLGLGADTQDNPARSCFSRLMGSPLIFREEPLFFPGGVCIAVDPVQGVPGIPQSATGQTSLFTGVNAQAAIGTHLTAFPNPPLMEIIREKSLLKVLKDRGVSVTYANLYTRGFLRERMARRKNMLPVSALSIQAAGIPFRMPRNYLRGRAVFADITSRQLMDLGFPIRPITPRGAAERVLNILEDYQAVFFEYPSTDTLGHSRDGAALAQRLGEINDFTEALVEKTAGWEDFLLLVCSDHGNAEDMGTADHTLNPVPLLLLCRDRAFLEEAASSVRRLTDIYDLVLRWFAGGRD